MGVGTSHLGAANRAAMARCAERLQAGCSDPSVDQGEESKVTTANGSSIQSSRSTALDTSLCSLNLLHFLHPGKSVMEETCLCVT